MARLQDSAKFALTTLRAMRNGLRFAADLPAVASAEPSATAANGDNPLVRYFDSVTKGPGIWKWRHYFPIYHRHLAKFVGHEVHVLEIGVYSGGSLPMWLEYFGDGCQVYGVDIAPACIKHQRDRVKVFIGDQSDPAFWDRVVSDVPRIDVVIDDGSHVAEHQIASLESLLPNMAPGGAYICEDLVGLTSKFDAFVDGLSRRLNHVFVDEGVDGHQQAPASGLHQHLASVHRYPMMTVLEKPEMPFGGFESEKHGTVWEPGIYED
jgi:cephalosporin hydroxylase